jgi:hypothetical protein
VNDRDWQVDASVFLPDVLGALQMQAREYRERSKLDTDAHLEVNVPERVAHAAIVEHGSLRAAADSVFNPGSVTIFCQEWRDVQDKINTAYRTALRPFRITPIDVMFRIAVTYGGKS